MQSLFSNIPKPRGDRLAVLAEDAEPVTTYRDAIRRVASYMEEARVGLDDRPLPFVILLVADLFWVKPGTVRRDLLAALRPF